MLSKLKLNQLYFKDTQFVSLILILGGDSIRSFAFAMILGVVIGTLSSLFVAAPVAYLTMGHKMKDTEKAEA